jgi:MbtH protein
MTIEDDARRYRVVVNDEEQFSVWPVERGLPDGWSDTGVDGARDECLAHIARVWTDIRPLSMRADQAGRSG